MRKKASAPVKAREGKSRLRTWERYIGLRVGVAVQLVAAHLRPRVRALTHGTL